MADLQAELNRLAGTSGLDAQRAANVGAGTAGLDLVGALNVWAGTSGLEMNGALKALAADLGGSPSADGPGALVTASRVGVLQSESTWRVRGEGNQSFASMQNLVADTDSTPGAPNPKVVTAGAYGGSVLTGQVGLTGGTNTGDWFTNLHASGRAGLLPLAARNPAQDPLDIAQLMIIPVEGTSHGDVWLELSLVFQSDGVAVFYLDCGGGTTPGVDRFNWTSPTLAGFDWRNGWQPVDWSIKVVAATGAVTLVWDGTTYSDTMSPAPVFAEPPDGTETTVGPDWGYPFTTVSATLRSGIDGSSIISFSAAAPTGWAGYPNGGSAQIASAPSRRAWIGSNQTTTAHSFASASVFNIGAGESRTWVMAHRPHPAPFSAWWTRNIDAVLESTGAGWAFADLEAVDPGLANAFIIGDGTDMVVAPFGTLTYADQVMVAVLDRGTNELRTYLNGTLVSTIDATALGAVSPSAAVSLARTPQWLYDAQIYPRVLTAPEIASLTTGLV